MLSASFTPSVPSVRAVPDGPSANVPPIGDAPLPVQRATLPGPVPIASGTRELTSAPPLDLPVRQVPAIPRPALPRPATTTGWEPAPHATEPVAQRVVDEPEPVVTDTLGAVPPQPVPTSTMDTGTGAPAASLPVQRATGLPPVPPRRLGLGAPLSPPEPPPQPVAQRTATVDPLPDLGEFAVPEHQELSTITVEPPERPLLGDLPMPIRQQSTAPRVESGTPTAPAAPRPAAPATPAPTVARLATAHQPAHHPAHQPLSVATAQLVPVQRTVAEPAHQPAPESTPVAPAEPVVQTVTVQRVETAAPAAPAAPATPATEDLLAKLYDPLLRRLRTELRVERDRRGTLTDLRH